MCSKGIARKEFIRFARVFWSPKKGWMKKELVLCRSRIFWACCLLSVPFGQCVFQRKNAALELGPVEERNSCNG